MLGHFTDMGELPPKLKLMDVITPSTTKEEFEILIDCIVTDEDRKLFGFKVKDFVINSILYPVVFAPKPATFESEAYAFVIDDVVSEGGYENMDRTIDPDRISRLMTISLENGVIDMEESGGLSIPKEVQDVLRPIFLQYT